LNFQIYSRRPPKSELNDEAEDELEGSAEEAELEPELELLLPADEINPSIHSAAAPTCGV